MAATLPLAAFFSLALAPAAPAPALALPSRIRRIVLHTLGGPFYGRPDMRWVFLTPPETLGLWKRPTFGAHWIVWIDGSIWPRHRAAGESASFVAPSGALSPDLARRLVREAAPVYSHVEGHNGTAVGIEVSHSGRSADGFPPEQARAVAWLVSALLELSHGRLSGRDVVGHKDLDPRPAFVGDRCRDGHCLAYVDDAGRPFRRRVDPPEGLFLALGREGLKIPRETSEGDAELRRSESIPGNLVPRTEKP
jgi:hypothetical protein